MVLLCRMSIIGPVLSLIPDSQRFKNGQEDTTFFDLRLKVSGHERILRRRETGLRGEGRGGRGWFKTIEFYPSFQVGSR